MNEAQKWRWHQTNKHNKQKKMKIEKCCTVRDSLMERRKENDWTYRHIEHVVHIWVSRRQAHTHTLSLSCSQDAKMMVKWFFVWHIIFGGRFGSVFISNCPNRFQDYGTKLSSNSYGIDLSTVCFFSFDLLLLFFKFFAFCTEYEQNAGLDNLIFDEQPLGSTVFQSVTENCEYFCCCDFCCCWSCECCSSQNQVRVPVAKMKIINKIIESGTLQLNGS